MAAMAFFHYLFPGEKRKHGLGLFFFTEIMYNIKLIAPGTGTGDFAPFQAEKVRLML